MTIQEIKQALQDEIDFLSKSLQNCETHNIADISKQLNDSIKLYLSLG